MQIQVLLLTAVLASVSAEHLEFKPRHEVLQTAPTPSLNFWSNLQKFSWGLTLGIPGEHMHFRVERCWYDSDAFFKKIDWV